MGPDEGEMDSLYAGGEPGGKGPEAKESIDQEEQEQTETTVVPLKILTGKDGIPPKEGEERVVKVVKIYGDEASIMYAPEKKESEAGGAGEKTADDELDEMSSSNPGNY